MRRKKPEGRTSGGIARIRYEEGWNYDKRKTSLTKNKIEHGDVSRVGLAAAVLKTEGSEMGV